MHVQGDLPGDGGGGAGLCGGHDQAPTVPQEDGEGPGTPTHLSLIPNLWQPSTNAKGQFHGF